MKVISDNMLQQNLIKKGYSRLKQFTWEKASCQYYDIYKSLLK